MVAVCAVVKRSGQTCEDMMGDSPTLPRSRCGPTAVEDALRGQAAHAPRTSPPRPSRRRRGRVRRQISTPAPTTSATSSACSAAALHSNGPRSRRASGRCTPLRPWGQAAEAALATVEGAEHRRCASVRATSPTGHSLSPSTSPRPSASPAARGRGRGGQDRGGEDAGAALGARLIRLQCYEGIDAHRRSTMELRTAAARAARRRGRGDEASCTTGVPAAPAPSSAGGRPGAGRLLIDEIDRADDEFEAFLLEFLSDFAVTVPELGTIPPAVGRS